MKLSEAQRRNNVEKKINIYKNVILPDTLKFTLNDKDLVIGMNDLKFIKNLGDGHFSAVQLMEDPKTNTLFAVKMFHNIADEVMKDILNDIEIGKSFTSKFKIDYYGGLKNNFDIWILMEPMDLSVKKFYQLILEVDLNFHFPGIVLGYFSFCSVVVLEEFHVKKLIHRDVKPSNMLVDIYGRFKLCDFGISGKLKDSLVQSSVGSNAYLAPERIAPETHGDPYSIISDVWSLGLSILEIAEMRFPFENSQSLMGQLNEIVNNPPPKLSKRSPYHSECPELKEFLTHTLVRNPKHRCRYLQLKPLKFISQFLDDKCFTEAQEILSILVKKYNT